jgi:glycosyltransferase 2 family protein
MVQLSQPPRSSTSRRTLLIRLSASLVLAGIFVWVLRAGAFPLVPSKSSLVRVNVMLVAAYVPLFVVIQSIRSFRWLWLSSSLSSLSVGTAMRVAYIAHAALIVLPLRMGEFVKPMLLRRHGVSAAAVASTIGAERIIDGLFVGLILFVSIAIAPGNGSQSSGMVTTAARLAVGGFSLAFALLVLLYFRRGWIERLTRYVVGWFSVRMAEQAVALVQKFASGLDFLRDGRAAAKYVTATAFYWILQIVGIWAVVRGCHLGEIGLVQICAVSAVLALGFLLPAPPGFFGAFQASYYAGLLLYLPVPRATSEGAAAVFYTYVIQMGTTLTAGLVSLWLERRNLFRSGALLDSTDTT